MSTKGLLNQTIAAPEGFQWVRPLGKGGMGEVWLVRHQSGGLLALKLLTHSAKGSEVLRDSLLREAQAMARLSHRNVIRILDVGTLAASDPASRRTYPFLLMELASYTLDEVDPVHLDWPTIRQILHQILEGLAHAHSRGVIHRDLKPANILVVEEDGQSVLRISDFGIAEVLREREDLVPTVITGTPLYMAPEQILGDLAAQGPWSDLYALGCVVYFLVTGSPPFRGTLEELLVSHLEAPRPPLAPLMSVPDGLERWVHRLLERSPERRYAWAADAGRDLEVLRSPEESAGTLLSLPLRGVAGEESGEETAILPDALPGPPVPSRDEKEGNEGSSSVIIPQSWKQEEFHCMEQLPGVGKGLFGLVEIPFVGRETLRNELWTRLRDTHHLKRPHLVLVQGQPGVGKTRLARWIAQRAHEVGVANYLYVSLGAVGSEVQGLAAALRSHLMIPAGDRDAALEKIYKMMRRRGEVDPEALYEGLSFVELLLERPDSDRIPKANKTQRFRFPDPEARWQAWHKFLAMVCEDRSLVLVVDDLTKSTEMQELLNFLLRNGGRGSLPLFVMATRSDVQAADGYQEELRSSPWTSQVDVEPLSLSDHRSLLRQLLGLSGPLVDQILTLTGGNPLFTVQLVGDWIERGILRAQRDGFNLAEGVKVPVPSSLQEILIQRFRDVVGGEIKEELMFRSLEVASLLGAQVALEEWRALSKYFELREDGRLLRTLEDRGLIELLEGAFRFSQGVVREALESQARQQGRWNSHHLLCATLLGERDRGNDGILAGRRARHLLAGGDREAALPLALKALTLYLDECRVRPAEELFIALCENRGPLYEIESPNHLMFQCTLVFMGMLQKVNRFAEVDELAGRLEEALRVHHDLGLEVDLLIVRARQARLQRLGQDALLLLFHALERTEQLGDPRRLADVKYNLAWVLRLNGELEMAGELLIDAMYHFRDHGRDRALALAQTLFANVLSSAGDSRALSETHRALKTIRSVGDKSLEASCLNNLGDVYRQRGDLAEAEEIYSSSLALVRRWDLQKDIVVRINLAWTFLEGGRFAEAQRLLEEVEEDARVQPGYFYIVQLGKLWSLSGLGELKSRESLIQEVISSPFINEIVDRDIAIALENCGRRITGGRSRELLLRARSQWHELGWREKVHGLDEMLMSREDLAAASDEV